MELADINYTNLDGKVSISYIDFEKLRENDKKLRELVAAYESKVDSIRILVKPTSLSRVIDWLESKNPKTSASDFARDCTIVYVSSSKIRDLAEDIAYLYYTPQITSAKALASQYYHKMKNAEYESTANLKKCEQKYAEIYANYEELSKKWYVKLFKLFS